MTQQILMSAKSLTLNTEMQEYGKLFNGKWGTALLG